MHIVTAAMKDRYSLASLVFRMLLTCVWEAASLLHRQCIKLGPEEDFRPVAILEDTNYAMSTETGDDF